MGVSVFHCYLRPTNLLVISAGPPLGSYSRCCPLFLFFSLKRKQDAMTMDAVGAEARMERSFILGQGHLAAIQELLASVSTYHHEPHTTARVQTRERPTLMWLTLNHFLVEIKTMLIRNMITNILTPCLHDPGSNVY